MKKKTAIKNNGLYNEIKMPDGGKALIMKDEVWEKLMDIQLESLAQKEKKE